MVHPDRKGTVRPSDPREVLWARPPVHRRPPGFRRALWARVLAGGLALGGLGCDDDGPGLVVQPPAPDTGCTVSILRSFEVYFVIDVSQSMEEFLGAVQEQLFQFANSFPERDANENRVFVDYYVLAFVNDWAFFPRGAARMTSPLAVRDAIGQAIRVTSDGSNLNDDSLNIDQPEQQGETGPENLLDALAQVYARTPASDRVLVVVATDADFKDQGDTLTPNIRVETSFEDAKTGLAGIDARVYAFTDGEVEGFDRNFEGRAPFEVEELFDLTDLADDSNTVGQILSQIAVESACEEDREAPSAP